MIFIKIEFLMPEISGKKRPAEVSYLCWAFSFLNLFLFHICYLHRSFVILQILLYRIIHTDAGFNLNLSRHHHSRCGSCIRFCCHHIAGHISCRLIIAVFRDMHSLSQGTSAGICQGLGLFLCLSHSKL